MATTTTSQHLAHIGLVICVVFGMIGAASAQDDLQSLMDEIETGRLEHETLMADFEDYRQQFDTLLFEIDTLKEQRDDASTMTSDADLREALRQAQAVAQVLSVRRDQLSTLSNSIVELESELLSEIDQHIETAEETLRDSEGEARTEAVSSLFYWSELRNEYLRPIPEVPSVALDEILAGLEDELGATPEELLATADELEDNELRLAEHLGVIEERLADLERQLTLQNRAAELRREASLFEEGVSSGRPANPRNTDSNTSTSADQEEENSGEETSASRNPTEDSMGGGVDGDGQTAGAISSDEVHEDASEPEAENTDTPDYSDPPPEDSRDGEADDDTSYWGDDGLNSAMEPGPGAPAMDASTGDPTLSLTPSLTSIGGVDQDPVIFWLGEDEVEANVSDNSVRSRIESLEGERERVQETLDDLREHREDLIQRAEELEEAEWR